MSRRFAACRQGTTVSPQSNFTIEGQWQTGPMTIIPTPMKPDRISGFTTIELMVTVVIAAILASMAAPSFRDTIARYKTSAVADEMANLLAIARMEAIKRGGDVYLQKKTAGANPCSNNQQWSCGLQLWPDRNRNGIQDITADPTTTESAIKELDVPAGVSFLNMSGNSAAQIELNRWGQANGINALNFRVTVTGVNSGDRSVCVTSGGRIRVVEGIACP